MKSNFIFSLVIAVMIHGGLLNPNYSFGFVNQNVVASVSSLEMWHLSKGNGAVKWTPKVQPAMSKYAGNEERFFEDVVDQLIQMSLIDAQIIKGVLPEMPDAFNTSAYSTIDLSDLQQVCHCIDARVSHLICTRGQFAEPEFYNNLAALQQASRILKTKLCHVLSDKDVSAKTMIVLDVDPGTDDAVAIYLCKLLQLAPTHFVATMGNSTIENTHRNLLILKNMFDLKGVVVRGLGTSLRGKVPAFGDFHGPDGLAGLQDSLLKIYVTPEDFASCRTLDDLAHDILSSDECIYIATGPLSSLGYILETYKYSGIENHISKVLIMGGGINRFNVSGDREYNFAGDGQAVNTVFSSSLDITLFPLDITELCATIDSSKLNMLESSPVVHSVIKKVIEQNFKSNMKYTRGAIGAVLHDCLPILYLMFPDKFELEDVMLLADATGKITKDASRGRMIHVAKSCDPDLVFRTILLVNNGRTTGACQQNSSKKEEIIILFETDVHGKIKNYARLAHLADSLSYLGKKVIIVSGGDFASGSFIASVTKGEAPVRIMNKIPQYVAIVLGNHEFDDGVDNLRRNDSLLMPPMICCNVFYRDSLLFKPYTIVNAGEKRIAFIGVLTCETKAVASPAELKASGDYRFLDGDSLAFQVQKYVDEVRRDSMADYVVVLAHLGNKPYEPSERKGISQKTSYLISHVSGVDMVLNGHDHDEIDTMLCDRDNNQIPELAAGKHFAKVGIIRIFSDGTCSTELFPIDSVKGVSSIVQATIDSIQEYYAPIKDSVIGISDFPLLADDVRIKETNLGDYVADAILWAAKQTNKRVSISFVNGASVRESIHKGVVTYGQVFDAVPFSNQICIVKLKGAEIESILNRMVAKWPKVASPCFPQVSGITFTLDTLSTPKVKKIMVQKPNGKWAPLHRNKVYYVTTTDYIAYGGDNVIDEAIDVSPLKDKMYMRDAVSKYLNLYGVSIKYKDSGVRINTSVGKTIDSTL